MLGFNNGARVLICLFLLYLDLKCRVLCSEAKTLKSIIHFCEVPIPPPHSNITYECTKYIKKEPKSCVYNGTVFESTVIKITCDPGYSTNGEDALLSVCHDNEWVPPIKGCTRKCKKLNPVNVHLECFHKDISIPCDEKYLLPGMTVRPTCKYASGFQSYPGHPEIHCQDDGNWDNDLLSCVQDCGRLPTSSNHPETWGMPWSVIIFPDKGGYICFGTIISPRVILTTEFCMLTNSKQEYDFKSTSRNSLDPGVFKVGIIAKDLIHPNSTWINSLKIALSLLNPFEKHKSFEPLIIKEFRYFKQGKQDKSLLHDALIVIMEKEINFNSRIHPACIQWKTPHRQNIATGIAKVQQANQNAKGSSLRYKDYSFLSSDACQENPAYPYFVFNWASLVYGFDKANRDPNATETFKLSSKKNNQTALHEGKLFCLELNQDHMSDIISVSGSGVMFEKEQRYFIRGIAGTLFLRDRSNNDAKFKYFMRAIRYVANISYENFEKNISDAISNGSIDDGFVDRTVFAFNYDFPSLLRKHLKAVGSELPDREEKLVGVTDIADYVEWIKKVVAEVDPYYNPST